MKKYLLLLLIPLLIGCQKEEIKEEQKEKVEEPTHIVQEEEEDKYVDTNPIKVGLYKDGKLIKEINNKFQDGKDIAILDIVYSNDEKLISTNIKKNWNKYYNQYENIKEYKTGFYFSFETNEKKYENLMLDPSSQYKLDPYLYAYLYDGIHATGRYSHLKMQDINNDTVYSSIKLYLHQKTKEIISPITLTVFTYKDENDFIDGKYRGNSSFIILINNK